MNEETQESNYAFEGNPIPLFAVVFIIAICGILYELIIGTCSSYLLGDSVYQFSITIGIYLSAMGLGSYLSKKFTNRLMNVFFAVELLVGLVGGFSSLILLAAYTMTTAYQPIMITLIVLIGGMVGFEIPILIRILEGYDSLRETLANVLAFDYIGALIGSVAFPLLLLPKLGVIKAAFAVSMLNMAAVFIIIVFYRKKLDNLASLFIVTFSVTALLAIGFVKADEMSALLEARLFGHKVVFRQQTKYQKINITRWNDDLRLYINNHMQFCSVDEYRYHEALVHPAMGLSNRPSSVLILGGGDGLAAREVFKYPEVKRIVLVDIDPEIVKLCRTNETISKLNRGSLSDPRLEVVSTDAYKFLENTGEKFGCILVDLPDPNNVSLSKLYTVQFYRLAAARLADGGAIAVQSTSLFFAPLSFWCIHNTMKAADLKVIPFNLPVASFGDWGFQLAAKKSFDPAVIELTPDTLYLDGPQFLKALAMAGDEKPDLEKIGINTLIYPKVLEYYERDWKKW